MRSGASAAPDERFSLSRVSDIGQEKRCLTCGEYWPADGEFFEPTKKTRDRLSARCIACIKEKTWASVLISKCNNITT